MNGVSLDLSVNLTSMIALAGALVTFVTAFNKLTNRMDLHTATMNGKFTLIENRISSVEESIRDNKATNARIIVIEERQNTQAQMIASLNVDVHDLRMGKGRIV